jgi:cytochrome c biogenesis protein CcmG/thiol:disulfide interchange protein DsbE
MTFTSPDKQINKWIYVIITALVLGTGWIYLSRVPRENTTDGSPPPSPREGFSAPGFTLELLSDSDPKQEVSLADYRGQVVMINIWATWCPPCRAEMPAIQDAYQEYKDQGLVVLAINTTFQDSEADVRAFVTEFELSFPILLDRTGDVSMRYQLRGLPSTYFIDRKGVIQSVVVGGPMAETVIRSNVENLLKERP